MGKVFVDVGMSLDGFIAGPNAGPRNPLGARTCARRRRRSRHPVTHLTYRVAGR
jgi:hypothetical protein